LSIDSKLGTTGGSEEMTWACEAEESPMMEAVAREWLVKD
jgi:hypothetical protein